VEERWKLTPGVPQISVNSESLLESITRLRPKSAIMMSASGAFERKRRFSGFKSVVCALGYQVVGKMEARWVNGPRWTMPQSWMYLTDWKIVRMSAAASLYNNPTGVLVSAIVNLADNEVSARKMEIGTNAS
jgi:hypothetical protein